MGYTDIHCHILPGVDDGAKDGAVSAAMLKQAAAEGITAIIVTPHFRADRELCTPEKLEDGLKLLRSIAAKAAPGVTLYPGGELRYRSGLAQSLRDGELPTLAGSRRVLVEFGTADPLSRLYQATEELLRAGYTPVLAHVERYRCLRKNPSAAAELADMGAELQINADSVLFGCGFRTGLFCRRAIRRGLITYIGTDSHSDTWRKPELKKCAAFLTRRYGNETAAALLGGNCGRITGGDPNG